MSERSGVQGPNRRGVRRVVACKVVGFRAAVGITGLQHMSTATPLSGAAIAGRYGWGSKLNLISHVSRIISQQKCVSYSTLFENVSIVVAPVAFKEEPETAAEEAWERNGESVSHANKRSQ